VLSELVKHILVTGIEDEMSKFLMSEVAVGKMWNAKGKILNGNCGKVLWNDVWQKFACMSNRMSMVGHSQFL